MNGDEREVLDWVLRSLGYVAADIADSTLEAFVHDRHKMHSVERNLITIGEALGRLRRHYPERFARLPEAQYYIALRNIIVHSYDKLDYTII